MASTKTVPAADPTKSTAFAPIAGAPDATNWEKEQTGFAPYWNPEKGKVFFGKVVQYDDTQPDFIRFLMELKQDGLDCFQGPKETQVPIQVRMGDQFVISCYTQLEKKFLDYLDSGINPIIRCEAVEEVKTKTPGQTCWIYDLRVSPDDMKKLKVYRAEKAQLKAAEVQERRAIEGEKAA